MTDGHKRPRRSFHDHLQAQRLPLAFLAQEAVVPGSLRASFVGGYGALMLVDYSESNCGPYRELLLIPGSFRVRDKTLASISRIFVSTTESLASGRRNWGIPKELADFSVVTSAA